VQVRAPQSGGQQKGPGSVIAKKTKGERGHKVHSGEHPMDAHRNTMSELALQIP
jgi:hypothetical protein